ncbi:hypothetical protein [Nostoc sp. CALU 546]
MSTRNGRLIVRVDADVATRHLSCQTVHEAFAAHGFKFHKSLDYLPDLP